MVGWWGRKCDSVPESVFKSSHGSKGGSLKALQQGFASGSLLWEENKGMLHEFIVSLVRHTRGDLNPKLIPASCCKAYKHQNKHD